MTQKDSRLSLFDKIGYYKNVLGFENIVAGWEDKFFQKLRTAILDGFNGVDTSYFQLDCVLHPDIIKYVKEILQESWDEVRMENNTVHGYCSGVVRKNGFKVEDGPVWSVNSEYEPDGPKPIPINMVLGKEGVQINIEKVAEQLRKNMEEQPKTVTRAGL